MLQHLYGAGTVAREYRRLSDAQGGTSLARQGSDNKRSADENTWKLGDPYVDDGLSASKYARKRRDDFEQLVADLNSGETGRNSAFGADVLMLWESSRGSRQVGEWVQFIELLEEKQVLIWVTTHDRLYDPRNGRDRKSLIEDAVDSEYESYKTHVRVSGTTAYEASQGRPHGKAPDGLMPVYDPATGDLQTWVENPKRSAPVKEVFRLLELGHSLNSIEGLFREAGYLNLSGRPFRREHLRHMAMRHAYAGLRVHKGEVYEAVWDGFIPRERFWNVQGLLGSPSRRTGRDGAARHVLTAALRCGLCRSLTRVEGLNRSNRNEPPVYRCQKNCLQIQKAPVDDYIIGTREEPGALLEYLARDDLYQQLAAPEANEDVVRELRAQLARERVELQEMEQAKAKTLAEAQVLARSIEDKRTDVNRLEVRERDLTLPPAILHFVQPGVDVWDSWEAAPVSARREVARVVLSARGLGEVHVRPALRTGPNQPITERLGFHN